MYHFLYSLVFVLFASSHSAFAAPFPLKEDSAMNLAARGAYSGHVSLLRIEFTCLKLTLGFGLQGTWYNVGKQRPIVHWKHQ